MSRIGIIVLAAGRSTRFNAGGSSKLTALVGGIPIVRRAVMAAIESDVGEIVVVTGHEALRVAASLDGLPVRLIHEPNFASGMSASLRSGVRALRDSDAVLIALGDQPAMRPEAYRRVSERWRSSGEAVVVPRYAGASSPSHPPLFAARVFDELVALEGDIGARAVIARDPSRVVEEPLEWSAPEDVDTLADLDALQAALGASPRGDLRGAMTSPEPNESR